MELAALLAFALARAAFGQVNLSLEEIDSLKASTEAVSRMAAAVPPHPEARGRTAPFAGGARRAQAAAQGQAPPPSALAAQPERWTIYKDSEAPVQFGIVEGKMSVEAATQKGDSYFEAQLVSHAHFRSIMAYVDLSTEGFTQLAWPNKVHLLTIVLYEKAEGLAEAVGPPRGKEFDVNLLGKATKCDWRDTRFNGIPALAGVKGLYDEFVLLIPGSYPWAVRARSQYDPAWKDPRFIARRNHFLDGMQSRFGWRKPIPPGEAGRWREHILKMLGCGP